jgi:hypothetical protein
MSKMVWKRLSFGSTKQVADDVAQRQRKQGEQVKVTHGKMGYSVLIKAPSFKKK